MIERLADADHIVWAVAFARLSGFDEIKEALEKRIAAGMSATFVVGIDFFQTDPTLILALLKLRKSARRPDGIKIYMGREAAEETLHPKVYMFRKSSATTAVVGSANMTWGGLVGNHEFSAVLEGKDVDWEDTLAEWIKKCLKVKRIVAATPELVQRYAIRRDIHLVHMKIAENRARKAIRAPAGNVGALREILAEMRADRTEEGFDHQMRLRARFLATGPAVLAHIAALERPPARRFLSLYEQLLGTWHSGGLNRGKTTIANEAATFSAGLRALAASKSKKPAQLYDLLLGFMARVPKAGVNVITEILHSRDPTLLPVMNANSVSGMRLAGIANYPAAPNKKTVDGATYAHFCDDANKVRTGLGLANFSELDAVFNYAYFHRE